MQKKTKFSANDYHCQAWFLDWQSILNYEKKMKDIIAFNFLLFWFWLYFPSLSKEQHYEPISLEISIEVIT